MSAMLLWIALPALIGLTLIAIGARYPWIRFAGLAFAGGLALAGLLAPLENPFAIGPLRVMIRSETIVLGRSFFIGTGLARVIGASYGALTLWGFGAQALKTHRFFLPSGMIATAFLCAGLSVQPSQFAGIFVLLAVLVLIPLLVPPGAPASSGVLRFLAFQAIGVPFFVFAGTLLEGLESIPAGLSLTLRPGIFLGLSFIFLLAIFPFHGWIPGLTEEYDPFSTGFILVLLPGFIGVLGLQMVDRYAFLRGSEEFFTLVRTVGILSTSAGAALILVQRHAGRILGYAVLIETGMLLIAVGTGPAAGPELFFPLFAARSAGFLVWSGGLSGMRRRAISLRFEEMRGSLAAHPVVCTAVLVGTFSTAGFPLLAGFPARLRLTAALADIDPTAVLAIWLGMAAAAVAGARTITAMAAPPDPEVAGGGEASGPDDVSSARSQAPLRLFLAGGSLLLLVFGLFPGWIAWLAATMPAAFERLAR